MAAGELGKDKVAFHKYKSRIDWKILYSFLFGEGSRKLFIILAAAVFARVEENLRRPVSSKFTQIFDIEDDE